MDHEKKEAVEEIQKNKTTYNVYSEKQRALFYYFSRIKLCKLPLLVERRGLTCTTAQDWAKIQIEIVMKKNTNKVNHKESQLQKKHKQHLLELFEKNPQATRQDAVDSLTEAFEGFKLKKNSVYNSTNPNCFYVYFHL